MNIAALFGQGSAEPYARALKRGRGSLMLRPLDGGSPQARVVFDVQTWCSPATPLEQTLLGALAGPLLDIGCGPGRLLAAAQTLGIPSLGLDTSAQAVEKALNRGTRALHQSVFAPVPQEGRWRSGVLLDANIGIGGNVGALLRRCAQLLAPDGTLLVEADPDDDADTAFQAVMEDDAGNLSEPFGWARVGREALAAYAERTDWQLALTQRIQGRVFCRLVRRAAALSTR
ncbi:MAG: class I SAM-dependent methyltransferase [Actinomycetota bacterium]|nr:class I SAM-dependent methyltransferase [Actinomycetota bacterium]